jgi:hypothetical protein
LLEQVLRRCLVDSAFVRQPTQKLFQFGELLGASGTSGDGVPAFGEFDGESTA